MVVLSLWTIFVLDDIDLSLCLENLGSTSVRFVDILPCSLESFFHQPSLPFTQKLFLNNGSSVVIKFVVQLLAPTPSH